MKNCRLRGGSGFGRRQNFEAEFFGDVEHAGNVLLLLRGKRANGLEEPLETRGSDDAHETPGSFAEVAVSVRDAARRKDGCTF